MEAPSEPFPWPRLLRVTFVLTLFIFASAALRHLAGRTAYAELGRQTSLAYEASQGRSFQLNHQVGGTHLSAHPEVFTQLLGPLLWLWPSAMALQAVMALGLGAGFLVYFGLGRELLGSNRGGWYLASLYTLHPAVHYWHLAGYQSQVLLAPILGLGLLGLIQGSPALAFLGLTLALSLTQEVAVTVTWLGLLTLLAWSGRRRYGLILAATGAAWLYVSETALVLPLGGETFHERFGAHYGHLGATPGDALAALVADPGRHFSQAQLVDLALMVGTTGGFALLAPEVLLVGVPFVLYAGASLDPAWLSFRSPSWGVAFPFVLAATAVGVRRALATWQDRSPGVPHQERERTLYGFSLVVSLCLLACLHGLAPLEPAPFQPRPWSRQVAALQALIPPADSLWVQADLYPHFAARDRAAPFPLPDDRFEYDWLLLAPGERSRTRSGAPVGDLGALGPARARRYRIVFDQAGAVLLRRTPGAEHPQTWPRLEALAAAP